MPFEDDFDLDSLIPKLQISIVPSTNSPPSLEEQRFDACVKIELAETESETWLQKNEEDLFYKVPKRIISYVENGFPSRL